MRVFLLIIMGLLMASVSFAQGKEKIDIRVELVDKYPVKFTFRFMLDGKERKFEKIYECRVTQAKRYYQGKIVKKERERTSWDTKGYGKNIDHIFEDGSAIRLRFGAKLAQGCPRNRQHEVVDWTEYVNDPYKDFRWLPTVYWVDSVTEPSAGFKVSFSDINHDFRDQQKLYFSPIGYDVIRLNNGGDEYESTEDPLLDRLQCTDYYNKLPGREKNTCALMNSKSAYMYPREQWSSILPLKQFLEKIETPLFLDPELYPEIRPLYSYSEAQGDVRWNKKQPDFNILLKDDFASWRGAGEEWRRKEQPALRIKYGPLHNIVGGRLKESNIFTHENSPKKSYVYYGGERMKIDPFYLQKGEEIKVREQLKKKFSKIQIGSKVFDLEDYRKFADRNRFGLYFYDPESELLFHIYR